MNIRQFAMLLIGIVVIAVMLRGFYVVWRARQRQTRLDMSGDVLPDDDPDTAATDELPSGGARLVRRRGTDAASRELDKARGSAAAIGLKDGEGEGGAAPILMDTVKLGGAAPEPAAPKHAVSEPEPETGPTDPEPASNHQAAPKESEEILSLNVMAKGNQTFTGEELVEILITAGLKFGEMDIFHSHLGGNEEGPVIFSVANILNPGTFDLSNMRNFRTKGLTLFLVIPSPKNNQQAFNDMLRMAEHLKTRLDGELRDDQRNLMTSQTVEHYRDRIRDFELHRMGKTAPQSRPADDKDP